MYIVDSYHLIVDEIAGVITCIAKISERMQFLSDTRQF